MRYTVHALILVSLGLFLIGCQVHTVRHEPEQAVRDTNYFLKALYVDENYRKALELADPQLREALNANDLKRLAEGILQQHGKLKTLKADSYLMTPGSTMELFYIAEYEKGTLYHRLVLMGDVSSGYRVSGVWYADDPYPEQALRLKFEQEIRVK